MAIKPIPLSKFRKLQDKMSRSGIDEKDVIEQFIHSSGKGGQNVNKVTTCVQLHHKPTGIIVKSQRDRTQGQNRIHAREILLEKIIQMREKEKRLALMEKERERRKKRKRSKKAKETMLENKRRHAKVKEDRRKIKMGDIEG